MWEKINRQSEILFHNCLEKKITVTTAESCTGGMIASSIVSFMMIVVLFIYIAVSNNYK